MLGHTGKQLSIILLFNIIFTSTLYSVETNAADEAATATHVAWSTYTIRKANEDKVVYIESIKTRKDGTGAKQKRFGTGFVLSEEGHILTASHVILEADADTVVTTTAKFGSSRNSGHILEFIKRDPEADGALLQLPNILKTLHGVNLGLNGQIPDEALLYVLGFPDPLFNINSGSGVLTDKRGPSGKWVTSIPLNRGNSGGPIFDIAGKVVAMAIGGADEYQGITYVTPIRHLKGLIDMVVINASDLRLRLANDKKEATRQFAFYQAVGHDEEQINNERFCLPKNYKVTEFSKTVATQSGSEPSISVETTADSPNCVVLTSQIKGFGVDKIGPIITEYNGRGWIGGELIIRGAKTK